MGYAQDVLSAVNGKDVRDQSINTKEDFEILNGCFLGNHIYEETMSLRQVKLAKIIDML